MLHIILKYNISQTIVYEVENVAKKIQSENKKRPFVHEFNTLVYHTATKYSPHFSNTKSKNKKTKKKKEPRMQYNILQIHI